MFEVILNVIKVIIAFGFMIFIHELGHFIGAKLSGVKVLTFSIGYGKAIFAFNFKGTKYQLAWIPFGGFCKMQGEGLSEDIIKNKNYEFKKDEFYGVSPLKRLMIVFFGPFFNYISAIILLALLLMAGTSVRDFSPKVDIIKNGNNKETLLYKKGIRTGFVLVKINNQKIYYFSEIMKKLNTYFLDDNNNKVTLSFLDKNKQYNIEITQKEYFKNIVKKSGIGLMPFIPPIVDSTIKDMAAEKAGIKKGDLLISINNVPVKSFSDISKYISLHSNEILKIKYKRNNKLNFVELKPVKFKDRVIIGIAPKVMVRKIMGVNFFIAFKNGFIDANNFILMQINSFRAMFKGNVSLKKSVSGPIGIVNVMYNVSKINLYFFIKLIAMLSVVLAVMNLLPIPVVDGSHIIYNLLELITRRRIPFKIIAGIQTVGFFLLIGLVVIVSYNDVLRFFF